MTKLRFLIISLVTVLLIPAPNSRAQSASPTPSSGSGAEAIIPFLNQSIVWYRDLTQQQQLATEPSDVLFFNDNR